MKALLLAPALLLALSACSQQAPPANTEPAHNHSHQKPAANAPVESHAGHGDMDGEAIDFIWDKLSPPAPSATVDLKNAKDPVSLKPVGAATLTYKGYVVHFESEATRARFEKKPLKFLNMLSLEPAVDGSVKHVDTTSYQDAVTEFCPIMKESEVDPHGTVYLLHRGWKFFFCCWTGCGDAFMKEPSKYYDYYGLVESGGKLVKK